LFGRICWWLKLFRHFGERHSELIIRFNYGLAMFMQNFDVI
jgi:hypothetical protein